MKKLEIIIRPEKLEQLKHLLSSLAVHGAMMSNIMGYGNQRGYIKTAKTKKPLNFMPKMKVETVVSDDIVDIILKKLTEELSTGQVGDGKVFIYDVADAARIRTGERGEKAL
ncbi:MAG: P-II family nitrogen regulator [Chloroflexi bacterium]|nr:P-II family nitrogen regulator [Chloroflexota bacterium]